MTRARGQTAHGESRYRVTSNTNTTRLVAPGEGALPFSPPTVILAAPERDPVGQRTRRLRLDTDRFPIGCIEPGAPAMSTTPV